MLENLILLNEHDPCSLYTNGFFFLVRYNKLGMVHCMHQGVTCYKFQIKIVFVSLKIIFAQAKCVDPDKMRHDAAFHLVLHRLPKYLLGPSIHGLVTDIQINIYIGNTLSRLSFQN